MRPSLLRWSALAGCAVVLLTGCTSPAADAQGYVLQPNVDGLVEAADMKAAQRSYEANLNAIDAARSMTARTLDLLK